MAAFFSRAKSREMKSGPKHHDVLRNAKKEPRSPLAPSFIADEHSLPGIRSPDFGMLLPRTVRSTNTSL